MSRLEEIAIEYGLCNCDEAYTSRNLTAPDCPFHAFALSEAMEKYAIEVAKSSLEKASENANMHFHDGYWKTNSTMKYYQYGADNLQVNNESITDPDNIVLL